MTPSFNLMLLFPITLSLLLRSAQAAQADPSTVRVGDVVCFEGFVMDNFCISRGTLFDNASVTTLLNPERHSVHCLLDVGVCRRSNYELLMEPADGETMYTRAFQLDDDGKATVIELGREAGTRDGGSVLDCTTCSEGGSVQMGLRAEVRGTVTAMSDGDTPATLLLNTATISNGMANVCAGETVLVPVADSEVSEKDDNDLAIKILSGLSVAAIAILAVLSTFGHLFQKKDQA